MENGNSVEPGCNSEQDTRVVCDKNSASLSSTSIVKLKTLIWLQIMTTTKRTMKNVKDLSQSLQLAEWAQFHYPTTLWMVGTSKS